MQEASKIINDVVKNGEEAVIYYSNKFDNTSFKDIGDIIVTPEEINAEGQFITVKGEKIDLKVKKGRIKMEIEEEEIIEEVKKICDEIRRFGYNIHVGSFIRKQKTVTEDIK